MDWSGREPTCQTTNAVLVDHAPRKNTRVLKLPAISGRTSAAAAHATEHATSTCWFDCRRHPTLRGKQPPGVVLGVGVIPDPTPWTVAISAPSGNSQAQARTDLPNKPGSAVVPNMRDTVDPFIRTSFAFSFQQGTYAESAEVHNTDGGVRGEINVFSTLVRLPEGCRADRRSPLHGRWDPILSRKQAHVVTAAVAQVSFDILRPKVKWEKHVRKVGSCCAYGDNHPHPPNSTSEGEKSGPIERIAVIQAHDLPEYTLIQRGG